MLPKVLTWSALAATLLFAVIALVSLFARESLGEETALNLANYVAVPLVTLAIALAVAVLMVLDPAPPADAEEEMEESARRQSRALANVVIGGLVILTGIVVTVLAAISEGPFRSTAGVSWGLIVLGAILLYDGLAERMLRHRV